MTTSSEPSASAAPAESNPSRTDAPASRPRRPRALLWWSLGLLAALAAMGVLVALNPASPLTQPIDDAWRALVGVGPDSAAYTWFGPMAMQYLGEIPGFVLSIIVIPLLLVCLGRWRSALFFMSATLLGPGLYSQVAKNLVDRPRPAADAALGLYGPLFRVDHGSFPSGHAASAAALVVGVAALIPAARIVARRVWWIVGALIMAAMVWQRTLINAHWLSDTILGLAAGASAALLMWWAFWPWLRRDYNRPLPFSRPALERTPA